MRLLFSISIVAYLLWMPLMGCSAPTGKESLEAVARDWCRTIRASQVVPIYPLKEDLQPGDVFLVTTTVQAEADRYESDGYLSLDLLVTRLPVAEDYVAFYSSTMLDGFARDIPVARPRPRQTSTLDPTALQSGRFDLAPIPAALFPTYSFHVDRRAGLRVALPVKGVPIALGYLQGHAAVGTVVLRDAYTIALPSDVLLRRLRTWVVRPDVRTELTRIKASVGDEQVFLRVVNRVYLVGGMDVSLWAGETGSFDLGAGMFQPLELPRLSAEQASQDDTVGFGQASRNGGKPMTHLARDVAGTLPGGRTRLTQTSSKSVSVEENFGRLLAFGYLGFDVEILQEGKIGPPVSTFYRAEGATPKLAVTDLPTDVRMWGRLALVSMYYGLRAQKDHADVLRALDSLAEELPQSFPVRTLSSVSVNPERDRATLNPDPPDEAVDRSNGFQSVITYWDRIDRTIRALETAAAHANTELDDADDSDIPVPIKFAQLQTWLNDSLQASEDLNQWLNSEPALGRAMDLWFSLLLEP